MLRLARAALAAALIAATLPAAVHAATVRVDTFKDNSEECLQAFDCDPPEHAIEFDAGKGERNRLTVTQADRRFHDDGATIKAGKGCKRVSPHEATCRKPSHFLYINVEAKDRSDEITLITTKEGVLARGGSGRDVLQGGDGDDVLRGSGGSDTLLGGPGDDDMGGDDNPRGPYPADHFDGGPGIDAAGYTTRDKPVSVNLGDPAFPSGQAGEGDTYTGVEVMSGGNKADVLIGSPGPDSLHGDFGNDRIEGLGGDDVIGGDFGADDLQGGDGSDTITGADGADQIDGGCGPDTIDAGSSKDTIKAVDGSADTIDGGPQKDSAEVDDGLDSALHVEQLAKLPPPAPC
jgi:Ca2+-binding RTX toxin-like protein